MQEQEGSLFLFPNKWRPVVGLIILSVPMFISTTTVFQQQQSQLLFASCLMTRNDSTRIKSRLTDKRARYHFGETLALSGQVTTDRQFPSCSRAGRRDGSGGTVRTIKLETH